MDHPACFGHVLRRPAGGQNVRQVCRVGRCASRRASPHGLSAPVVSRGEQFFMAHVAASTLPSQKVRRKFSMSMREHSQLPFCLVVSC